MQVATRVVDDHFVALGPGMTTSAFAHGMLESPPLCVPIA